MANLRGVKKFRGQFEDSERLGMLKVEKGAYNAIKLESSSSRPVEGADAVSTSARAVFEPSASGGPENIMNPSFSNVLVPA
jgi:hypothetical protein